MRFPGLAAGVIRVQEHRGKYSTPDELQAIDVQHPALEPLRSVGLSPLLAIRINNSAITGYVTVSTGRRPIASPGEIVSQIRRHADTLGMLGMGDLRTPTFENKLDGGALSLKTDLAFTLGGFLKGTGSLGLSDEVVTFTAHADATVRGVANVALDLNRRADGVVEGKAEIPVTLKNFSGNFVIAFAGGIVDASGTFRYTTEKLSGEVTLLITDAQTARTVAYQHLPPEAIDASARNAAGGSAVAAAPSSAGPKPGPRAVAGWGTLDVHYNDWLSGRAMVIVDSQGHVTVVGKISPPGKVEFPQTKLDYERKIFGFEVRAAYGIPVVGNVFLFAGVGLFAIAKISPLTLSKIEIVGTYSTDPAIFNSFSLSANLNISALAGVRLRAEGGVGIEIAEHDIKIGAALTATAGIRAYVDATPLIGYRELADPTAGRRGEFYIHGEAEIAAQPFLALAGELFVKLVTPWWSPAHDHTWTWPLGELMYPLPGEIGVGADVDYVFGSGKLPTISPKKVDFNADRFMSDLMDDNVPHGSAADVNKPGRWSERLQAPPAPPAAPQVKDSKGPGKRKDDKPVKDAGKTWAAGMKAVGQLKQRGDTQPYVAAEIDAALKTIKSQHGFTVLQAKPVGDQWEIAATLGKDSLKKPMRIKRTAAGAAPPTAAAGAAPAAAAAGDKHPPATQARRQLQLDTDFSMAGTPHHLSVRLIAGRPQVMMASSSEIVVIERLEALEKRVRQLQANEKRGGELVAALERSRRECVRLVAEFYQATEGKGDPVREAKARDDIENLKLHLQIIGQVFGFQDLAEIGLAVAFTYTATGNLKADTVWGAPLVVSPAQRPSGDPPGWMRLNRGADWVRAHLIPARLGGPSGASNLVPTPSSVNLQELYLGHERTLMNLVQGGGLVNGPYYWMRARVAYRAPGDSETDPQIGAPEDFAKSIDFEYGETKRHGNTWSDAGALARHPYKVRPPRPSELIPNRMLQ